MYIHTGKKNTTSFLSDNNEDRHKKQEDRIYKRKSFSFSFSSVNERNQGPIHLKIKEFLPSVYDHLIEDGINQHK